MQKTKNCMSGPDGMLLTIYWRNKLGIKAVNETTGVIYIFEPADIKELKRMELIRVTRSAIIVKPDVDLFSFVSAPMTF